MNLTRLTPTRVTARRCRRSPSSSRDKPALVRSGAGWRGEAAHTAAWHWLSCRLQAGYDGDRDGGADAEHGDHAEGEQRPEHRPEVAHGAFEPVGPSWDDVGEQRVPRGDPQSAGGPGRAAQHPTWTTFPATPDRSPGRTLPLASSGIGQAALGKVGGLGLKYPRRHQHRHAGESLSVASDPDDIKTV